MWHKAKDNLIQLPTNQNIFSVIWSVQSVVWLRKQKRRLSSERRFWNRVTSPKESKTVVWVKSSENQSGSLHTGRKPFFGVITLGTTQYYSKQTKIWCLCYKADCNVFLNKKPKRCFLWCKPQRSLILLPTNQNIFSLQQCILQRKAELLFLVS